MAPHASHRCSWLSRSPEDTARAADALGRAIQSQDRGEGRLGVTDTGVVLALVGELGAGKTLFTQALAASLGIDRDQVASPTFTIASEYPLAGGRRLVHMDWYRLESEGELEAAGFLDFLDEESVLVVEWADRFPAALPRDFLHLRLRDALAERSDFGDDLAPSAGAAQRRLEASAVGERSTALLTAWREHNALDELAAS